MFGKGTVIHCDNCMEDFCQACDQDAKDCGGCGLILCGECAQEFLECDHCEEMQCSDCHEEGHKYCKSCEEDMKSHPGEGEL